jgi:hypothetical protein
MCHLTKKAKIILAKKAKIILASAWSRMIKEDHPSQHMVLDDFIKTDNPSHTNGFT